MDCGSVLCVSGRNVLGDDGSDTRRLGKSPGSPGHLSTPHTPTGAVGRDLVKEVEGSTTSEFTSRVFVSVPCRVGSQPQAPRGRRCVTPLSEDLNGSVVDPRKVR